MDGVSICSATYAKLYHPVYDNDGGVIDRMTKLGECVETSGRDRGRFFGALA